MSAEIGIVIPCHNDEPEHLGDAVASALRQDVPVKVVVVNDGSTNSATLKLLDCFPPEVTVIHTENGGPAAARNVGIRTLATELVLPLDADDWIDENFAREASAALSEPTVCVAYSDTAHFGAGVAVVRPPWEVGLRDMLVASQFGAGAMFRRADWVKVGGYDETLRLGHEDYEFWVRLLATGGRAVKVPSARYHYRIRRGSRRESQGFSEEAVRATREAITRNNPDHREFFLTETQIALHLMNRENRRLRAENAWFQHYFGWAWSAVRWLRDGRNLSGSVRD